MIRPSVNEALMMAKEMPEAVATELLIQTLTDFKKVPSAALESRAVLLCNVFLMQRGISMLGYEKFRNEVSNAIDASRFYKTVQQ